MQSGNSAAILYVEMGEGKEYGTELRDNDKE